MPDISSNEAKNSATMNVEAATQSYNDEIISTTDQSGLAIFKNHKNKKSKTKHIFDRRLVSQSYDSGLNNVSLTIENT
jgi:hypothetical protein